MSDYLFQRANAAAFACRERSSALSVAIRTRVAFRAFLALAAAFFGLFLRPSATAALFFFVISIGSIPRRIALDKLAIAR